MIVGILGCGAIANILVNRAIYENLNVNFDYFFDRDAERAQNLAMIVGGAAELDFDKMVEKVDLVIEAASPISVETYALRVLEKGTDIMVMSVGALMNEELRTNLIQTAKKNNSKIYAPSGAIVGLDGVKAASVGEIIEAKLTTRKPPKSLGKDVDEVEVLFEGKASEAVKKFPANINVAATLSIACEKDIDVKIIVDPEVDKNTHEIVVKGTFGEFTTKTSNLPCEANPKTSMLAAYSAIRLLKNINKNLSIGT